MCALEPLSKHLQWPAPGLRSSAGLAEEVHVAVPREHLVQRPRRGLVSAGTRAQRQESQHGEGLCALQKIKGPSPESHRQEDFPGVP